MKNDAVRSSIHSYEVEGERRRIVLHPLFEYRDPVEHTEGNGPLVRGEKYEDPLDQRLRAERVGSVSGGEQQLGDARDEGTRLIEFCGLDVDVSELDRARMLIRDEVLRPGAPVGTELHYTRSGEASRP